MHKSTDCISSIGRNGNPIGKISLPLNDSDKLQGELVLKGRIEYRKDYAAILYAASQSPGIQSLACENNEVTIAWFSDDQKITDAPETGNPAAADHRIRFFIDTLKTSERLPFFQALGIEMHVFIESFKPIQQYDGARNSVWGCP